MAEKKARHLDTSAQTTAETFLRAIPPSGDGDPTIANTGGTGGTGGGGGSGGCGSGGGSGIEGDTRVLSDPALLPKRIGRYEIRRLIGSGGMGAVYEAVQDQPRRTVALKVMRAAVASPAALRRFEYESQLLAKLRHPAIAQVYDAGTHQDAMTMQSVPYFAMEYVPDASSLTAYAEDSHMPVRARLALFVLVCDAVQHGHQRGVIHRDLKPANILVDRQGSVKVIDFGVARSADPEGGGGAMMTQHTSVGQLVGTLQYMAPEQCGADTSDIDSRADVYALGVTLYELLTGKLPYELSGRSLAEAVRLIREAPPTSPSQRKRELRGDIETIILKALEKSPERRYDSASALAADIQRFLDDEPILARRIGMGGKAVRWVRRNRAVATVGAVAGVVLATTSIVLVTRILSESHRANTNLEAANDNLSRIKDMFAAMEGDNLINGMVNVGKIYDKAAERLDADPPERPEAEAEFREFLSDGYRGYGQYAKALAQQERAVVIREQTLPDPSPGLASSFHMLGRALWFNGRYAEADRAYSRSLDMRQRLYGARHLDVAASMTHLAACRLRQGRAADAEDYYKQALDMRRDLLPPGSAELAASVNNLAKVVALRGNTEEAERLFRQALEMITAAQGDGHLDTAYAAHNLAGCLVENGKLDEARACYERAVAIRVSKLPPTHDLVYSSQLGLARAKFLADPGPKALSLARGALAGLESQLMADHPEVANACIVVGRMHMQLDQPERAEPYLRRALSIYKDPARATAWELAESRLYLAQCVSEIGGPEEAQELLEQSVEAFASSQAPARLRAMAHEALAAMYESQGHAEKAQRVREGLKKLGG